MSREDARQLRRIVRRALQSSEAVAWRRRKDSEAKRWDDGMCADVAATLACFDKHKGRPVLTDNTNHCMYQLGNWLIDGHRIRHIDNEPFEVVEGTIYPSRTLLRLMHEAAA